MSKIKTASPFIIINRGGKRGRKFVRRYGEGEGKRRLASCLKVVDTLLMEKRSHFLYY
jgi:hypothetical protein